jgi:hypothetical protein
MIAGCYKFHLQAEIVQESSKFAPQFTTMDFFMWLYHRNNEKIQREIARNKEALCEKVRHVDTLLEEAEIEIRQLEALRLNSLSLKEVQRVAQQLKEVQEVQLAQVEHLEKFNLPMSLDWYTGLETLRLEELLDKLLGRVELILSKLVLVELIRAELRRRKELIDRFLVFLAMQWQKLLESLLFSHNVFEFPNKHRPPCTTMPWNIPPALIVLWGVCWMFHPWSPIDGIQLQPLSANEQTLFSSGKIFPHFKRPFCAADIFHTDIDNELTGLYQRQHSVTSNGPSRGLLDWGFPGLDLEDWDFSSHPEYGNLQSLNPEPFTPLPAPDTQLISTAEVAPLQNILAGSDPFSFPIQHVTVSELADLYVEPGSILLSEAPSGSTADQLAISLPGVAIETFKGAGLTRPNERRTASVAEGGQYKEYARLPTPSPRLGSARWTEHIADLPHKSTTYKRSEEPPQNAEGKMICKHTECSNLTFTRRCDWK